MYFIKYTVSVTCTHAGECSAAKNRASLFPNVDGQRAGTRVAERLTGNGTPHDWSGLVARAMAVAGWHAVVSSIGSGLWEVRTDLPTKRTARVLLCLHREHLIALHGFIKKTRATPSEDLALARKRQKELGQ